MLFVVGWFREAWKLLVMGWLRRFDAVRPEL